MAEIEDKESLARSQLPYRAEYCKTSRAKCKKCTEPMEGGSLKVANMVKSRFHDGYDANYYHTKCFFTIKRPSTVAEIANFETLKYEDQKMLEKAIDTNGRSLLLDSLSPDIKKELRKGGKKSSKREAAEQLVNYNDFLVEYAKTSRAKCMTCEQVIVKDDIRFGKMDYGADTASGFTGPVPRWYHKDCFAKSLEQLDFYGHVENIPTFRDLEREDQKMLKKQIKPISPPKVEDVEKQAASNGKKKVKVDKEILEEERALKEQSERFYALLAHVERVRMADLKNLMAFMRQKHDINQSAILQKLATDVFLYGPLKRCPKCRKRETMLLRNSSYICTRDDCDYETRDPEREAPDFPEEFTDKYEYFAEEYEFRGGSKRVFPRKFLEAVEQKEAEDNNLAMADAPLQGLDIGIITWNAVKNGKEKVQKRIITLGARPTTVMASSIFVILSNENELDKATPKMEVAKELGVPFARDDFLFNIKTHDDVVPQLTKSLIGNWKGDLRERFERMSAAAAATAEDTASQ